MTLSPAIQNIITVLEVSLDLTIRYTLFAGGLFLLFYVWKKYWYLKIQQKFPQKKHVFHEMKYSFYTLVIFGIVIVFVMWASKNHHTLLYSPIDKYGWPYWFLSILLMVALNDTYFYWTHRLMHLKPLFKRFHIIHHIPTNPTPFSAYCFHPVEAFMEVGIIPLIVFTIPYHLSALAIYSVYTLMLNVGGHLGFEFFPKWFAKNKISKWHNTATHHNMHHRLVKYNYGLYFNFWDRIMGTNHPHYEEAFDDVIAQREKLRPKAEHTADTGNNTLKIADVTKQNSLPADCIEEDSY